MRRYVGATPLPLGTLLLALGCNGNPPGQPPLPPGQTPPAPQVRQEFPNTPPPRGNGAPAASESSSFDYGSRNDPDQFSSPDQFPNEARGPSALPGRGAFSGDATPPEGAAGQSESIASPAETPFLIPSASEDASD